MPLQPQAAGVPLFGGLDLKTDAKFVSSQKLLVAENVRWPAAASVMKRYGQTKLDAELDAGVAAGTYLNELLAFDGANLQSYAQAQGAWVEKAAMSAAQVSVAPSIRSAGSVSGLTSVFTGDAELYAWEDTRGGVWYSVRDAQSGTFLVGQTQLDADGVAPQAFRLGGHVGIAYGTSTGKVRLAYLAAARLQNGLVGNILLISGGYTGGPIAAAASDNLGTPAAYIAAPTGTGGSFIIRRLITGMIPNGTGVFNNYAAAGTYRLHLAMPPSSVPVILFTMAPTTPGAGNGYVMVLRGDTMTADGSGATAVPLTDGHAVNAYYDIYSGGWAVVFDSGFGSAMPALRFYQVARVPLGFNLFDPPSVTASTEVPAMYGLLIAATSPALESVSSLENHFLAMSAPENRDATVSQQASFFLIQMRHPSAVVGQAIPSLAKRFMGGSAATGGSIVPAISRVEDTLSVAMAQQVALRADATGTVYAQTGIAVVDLTFPSPSPCKILTLGTSATVTCGNTYAYDGAVLVESGFWEFPDGITKAAVGSGGALSAGLYTYQITYEWADSAGNTHYSAPSYPVQLTTVANDSVTLEIPYTALTMKADATVNIYRSAVDSIGPLYFVASTPNLRDGTQSWTYTDTLADTAIAGQRLLYAPPDGSGELENDPPPPFRLLAATKTRLFGVAEDDDFALWYSKPLIPGRPAEWSAAQVIRVESDGGPITALGALDAQCVLFKGSRVYYLPGDGPNAAGLPFNAFPQNLTLISTTTGCNNPLSVLNTHEGVFFQSPLGLQVLTRSLQTNLSFGQEVQPLVQALNITGALSVPAQNQFRWISTDGTALVYDYLTDRWSTYTNHEAIAYVHWNGTAIRLRANGELHYEDTSVHTDNLRPVTMVVETAWLKPAQLAQGYAAVWYAEILGEYIDSHQLRVDVSYDYMPITSQTAVWDPTTNNVTYGTDTPYGNSAFYGTNTRVYTAQYQMRLALARQTCQSVKFRISDASQTGASCALNELTLQLGVIGGINRLPRNQQV